MMKPFHIFRFSKLETSYKFNQGCLMLDGAYNDFVELLKIDINLGFDLEFILNYFYNHFLTCCILQYQVLYSTKFLVSC